MNFCELDQRIDLQSRGETRDSMGGVTDSWSTLATVWAKREVLSGRQLEAAKAIAATVDTKFTLRKSSYLLDIDTTWRVRHSGNEYELNHVHDSDREWLFLFTTRRGDT